VISDDLKTLSQQRFTQLAEGYVTSPTHARGAELDLLVEMAEPQTDWVVLDVATGGGHTALRFAPLVARVIATDITPRMLAEAESFIRQQGIDNVDYEVADAEDLPFDDGSFELVTCRIAPHHFADSALFVREAARVLKRGGLLLVQDHLLPEERETARYVDAFEKVRDPSHNRALSETEWVALFAEAELTVERAEQVAKRHDFSSWTGRQECPPQTVSRLVAMVEQAPPGVVEWLRPRGWGTPQASFANDHIIIAGRRH
jgi:ubiquinone/menaquinone biosynthesis C-methylase UbiE